MNASDDFLGYPAEPGTETKIRHPKTHETMRGADDAAVEPPPWKINDVVAGFILEGILGSGVTSTVYKARELVTGRIYALKLLRTRTEETLTASRMGFYRMSPLKHSSLVRVHNILRVGDHVGITMEMVAGKGMVQVINETRGADRATVFELAKLLLHDLGGALQTIHEAGLVHRDVKPDNVMIDHRGRARLIDYGLVGSYDPESDPDAQRNYLAGTYWYMAPESISMQIYPPACDVYALGCIVLELIANRTTLPIQQIGISLGQSIGDVRTFLPQDTPPDLAELLCDMIDPSPQNRPLAARLVQIWTNTFLSAEVATKFRRGKLQGREKEMALAEQWVHSVVAGRPTRLHISGDSGVGKTWFLSELQRRIRANAWFQVFDSACRERDDVPLQAFDAIADTIARRYAREDREPIRLAASHAIVLRQVFPALRAVIHEPFFSPEETVEQGLQRDDENDELLDVVDEIGSHPSTERTSASLAGVELVDQMCEYGPVFLIVDDIQWADQDSLKVLDKLISHARGEIGIISVGRFRDDRFQKPADFYIELKPLNVADSFELLRSLLCTGEMQWNETALHRLAALGEGNAYQLTQLAVCVSHDDAQGWHSRLNLGDVKIEDIWKSRLDYLSKEAKIAIEFLATAGGPIQPADLAQVSELHDRCGDAVRELIDLRLIYDESPHRDSIDIIHQRISECTLKSIQPARFRTLHNAWSTYLMAGVQDTWRAARIAGHLIAADRPQAAVPHMIQAAFNAESRFAYIESAKWHHRISTHLSGNQSALYLWQSLNRYEDAGRPVDAAIVCRELIDHPARHSIPLTDIQLQQRLACNLIRSGAFKAATDVVQKIVSSLKAIGSDDQTKNLSSDERDAVAVRFSFARPMMAIDMSSALGLLKYARAALSDGRKPNYLGADSVDGCIIGCRNPGTLRTRSTTRLERLVESANSSADIGLLANAQYGAAFRHLLACDWASAISPATAAIENFRTSGTHQRFSEALAHVPMLWSYLWLGRLRELKIICDQLALNAHEQNDEFLLQIAYSGLGTAALLLNDDVQTVRVMQRRFKHQTRDVASPWLQLFHGLASMLRCIYDGKSPQALRYYRAMTSGPRTNVLRQFQMPRVICLRLEGILHLRLACHYPIRRFDSMIALHHVCEQLRHENNPYAKTIATYFDAQSAEIIGDKMTCLSLYREAADCADSLDLVPLRLAAIDRRAMVTGDKETSDLKRFLANEGVKVPDSFARLYCGLCP